MKIHPVLVFLGVSFVVARAEIKHEHKNSGGFCHSSFGDNYSFCNQEGRYKTSSLDECCSGGNATGYSLDTSALKGIKDLFFRRKQTTCQSCADSFSRTKKWCFAYRNYADGYCVHVPVIATMEAASEIDCCLWWNATGYTETPKWKWSASYSRWITQCNRCVRDKFVACFLEFTDNEYVGKKCRNSLPRLAESPRGCCSQPNVTGYAWIEKNNRLITDCNPCPVNGIWSEWSAWSPCSATCGESLKRRLRACDNPSPKYGGTVCFGKTEQTEQCDVQQTCPESPTVINTALSGRIYGSWSQWSTFSACSVTCGTGFMERKRICPNVLANCEGVSHEVHPCEAHQLCNIVDNVNWMWTEWSSCHQTCGVGVRLRSKICLIVAEDTVNQCTTEANVQLENCDLPPCSNISDEIVERATQKPGAVVTVWVIPFVVVTVLIVFVIAIFVYKRKECVRSRERLNNLKKYRTYPDKRLPAIPPSDPTDGYLPMTIVNQSISSNIGAKCEPRLIDEDGYEIPNDGEQTRLSLNSVYDVDDSDAAKNHVYEQLTFYQDKMSCLTVPTDVPDDLERVNS